MIEQPDKFCDICGSTLHEQDGALFCLSCGIEVDPEFVVDALDAEMIKRGIV